MDTLTEQLWTEFISELENKQAFMDMKENHQMPIVERQRMFKHYLSLWSKLQHLEKGTSERLFDHACFLSLKN